MSRFALRMCKNLSENVLTPHMQSDMVYTLALGQLYTYREIRENNREKRKVYNEVFRVTFFPFCTFFFAFCISQHFASGLAFT